DPSEINPKCDILPSIEIKTPINAFADNITDVSCFEGSDGAIDLTITGGEAPYTILWSRDEGGFSASSEDVNDLEAGTYNVFITDSNGCTFEVEEIVIDEPTELQATLGTVTPASCFG